MSLGGKKEIKMRPVLPILPILPNFDFHPCLFKVELATLNERMEGREAKQEVERSREA